MNTEIERKFLVTGKDWKQDAEARHIRQGYLSVDKERTVRVRAVDDRAWLTIKGVTRGFTRAEFEYPIPPEHAGRMLEELCHQPIIDKTRYVLRHREHLWEVDEFHGANAGLVVAEIELPSEQEEFARPPWLGAEVSNDPRFFNANLIRHPYRDWETGA